MTDFILFAVPLIVVLSLLYLRFCYSRSWTGLSDATSVGPSYWGTYTTNATDNQQIKLPASKGLCPRCGPKSSGISFCSEH